MKLSTFKDLVSTNHEEYLKYLKTTIVEEVPLYGPLYNVTYNQQDPFVYLQNYIDAIKEFKPKKCLETFSGNAIESFELSKHFPKVQFNAVDYNGYFKEFKAKNLSYYRGNCYSHEDYLGQHDFIYTGALNASNCCIDSVEHWLDYFKFVNTNIAPKGLLALSFFDDAIADVSSYHIFDTNMKITRGDYRGMNLKWLTITHKSLLDNSNTYYDLAIILRGEKPIRTLINLKGETFYSQNTATVISMAEMNGFELERLSTEERFALFKKVR